MTRKKRWVLFSIFSLLFFGCAFILIAYSRGYRLDNFNVVHTGGIYLDKIIPNQAKVSINGLPKKRPLISMSGGLLLDNLNPQAYEINVSMQGYYAWYKQISVASGMVESFKYIMLIPEKISSRRIDEIKNSQIIFSADKTVYLQNDPVLGNVIKIRQTGHNLAIPLPKRLAGKNILLKQASQNNEIFIFEENSNLIVFNSKTNSVSDLKAILQAKNLDSYAFSKVDAGQILYLTQGALKKYDFSSQKISVITASSSGFAESENGLIYSINSMSHSLTAISQTTPSKNNIVLTNEMLSASNSPFFIDISDNNKLKIKSEKNDLITADLNRKKIDLIDSNVAEAAVSPDNKKIAYIKENQNSSNLMIYYLEDDDSTGKMIRTGEKTAIASGKQLSKPNWLQLNNQSTHLIYLENENLKISEIDSRDRVNSALIREGVPDFYYNHKTGQLQWLLGDALWDYTFKF